MEKKEIDLVPEPKWFEVGNKKFDVSRISAERALKAAALFNKIDKGKYNHKTKKYEAYKDEYTFIKKLLDVVFLLIRIDFKIKKCADWYRRKALTKAYILKNIDCKEIMDVVETALLPIIGEKKKILDREEKMTKTMLELVDKVDQEVLIQLLQNFAQEQVTKKNTSSKK